MVTDILKRVRLTLERPEMSKHRLALMAGLHRNTLREADREDWNPSASTLTALEPFLVSVVPALCTTCDARLDDTAIRACSVRDCPHAQQEAA